MTNLTLTAETSSLFNLFATKPNKNFIWNSLQFTEYGIEGVVPLELLPPDARLKYQSKPNDRSKRAKKEEAKSYVQQGEENQVLLMPSRCLVCVCVYIYI